MPQLLLVLCLQAQLIEIPFRLASPDLPIVLIDLSINNGAPRPAIFDTGQGVAPLLVRQSEAKQMGMQFRDGDLYPNLFAAGGGASPAVTRSSIRTLRIGGQTFTGMEAGVSNSLDRIVQALGQPVIANLGYKFLKDYTVSLDYREKRIQLSKTPLAQGHPFVLGTGKPYAVVEARIDGQGPYRFAIDTGASNSMLSRGIAERLMLPHGRAIPVMGMAGTVTSYMTTAAAVAVAGRTYRNFTFATGDLPNIDGILGANAFERLTLTIDYPNRRLALR